MNQRVQFDFEIDFSNGGGIQGRDFRLDIASDDISDRELADHLVADMRLPMAGAVRIRNKRIIAEAHKRNPVDASASAKRYVDLSHVIENGTVTHRGLPAPVICDYLSREASRARYAPGTEFHIGKIEMVANTGTYVDSPFHRYAEGLDLSQLPLESLANLEAVVVRVPAGQRQIGRDYFERLEVAGKAVLVATGWDQHWRTEQYFEGHPFLTAGAAQCLQEAGATMVGIDSLNIDDTSDLARPVHSTLLGAGIPIVEHLCGLAALPENGARFFAVPVKVKAFGTFPVRAFALSPAES
jgi:kynurenine formamidase